jgi:hypothetical protein
MKIIFSDGENQHLEVTPARVTVKAATAAGAALADIVSPGEIAGIDQINSSWKPIGQI